MTKLELLKQIASIATTVDQVKYVWGLELSGLVSILNDLIKEYHQSFVTTTTQLTAAQEEFSS